MVEIRNLSVNKRRTLIERLNKVMTDEFNIDQKSINGFWDTFTIGAKIVKEQMIECQEKKIRWQKEKA